MQFFPNDLIEVRSKEEIFATLDHAGTLDGLPFMPEMLNFCGQRLTVFKRANKTCDTIEKTGARRMHNTVHLENIRCDGSAHGGCEAACLIFWKEAWLKPIGADTGIRNTGETTRASGCGVDDIVRAACPRTESDGDQAEPVYRCQVTQILAATEPLAWWDIRQYVRDLRCGNVTLGRMLKSFTFAGFRMLINRGFGYRALMGLYRWVQTLRGKETRYPYEFGTLSKTPTGVLNLQPGEYVRIKSFDEILATLNARNRNQGLYFDGEMVQFCGGVYRVQSRVKQILNEKTGRMMHFSNPCIILQDVYCRGELSEDRLFCPRAIYPYWREIWLERVDVPANTEPKRSTVVAAPSLNAVPQSKNTG